jgi:DNA-binding NarL/FixJ family response regulator
MTGTPESIRIILADDHTVLRSGLRALLSLEPQFDVIAEVSTGEDAIERARTLKPDVIVMDLGMPGIGGLEATRLIAELDQGTRVLVLTSQAEEDFLLPVLQAGGSGYVHKTSADKDLIEAIHTVARNEVFLYPRAAKLLLQGYRRAEEKGDINPLHELSEREREVLALSAEGFSSSEIGKKLYLSPKTVDTYRSRLMQKLGLTHRSELVRLALQTGLLKAE